MSLYWLYDIPTWLFALIVVGAFTVFGVVGLRLTREWVRRIHAVDHSHNDIVGYFLAALTVFYGISVGLVAVGTWETFSAVGAKVDQEAQIVGALWRDAGSYRDPWRSQLRGDLRDYLDNVIEVSWPLQERGITPTQSGRYLADFQDHLQSFPPQTMGEEVNQAELFRQFNELVQVRRARLNAVHSELPAPIWMLVIAGGLLCVTATWFFHTRSFRMHLWMTLQLCVLLGLIVSMIGILDNPFRGKVAVTSAPLQLVRDQLIRKTAPG